MQYDDDTFNGTWSRAWFCVHLLVPEKMQMCNGQISTILLALAGVWRLFSICMLRVCTYVPYIHLCTFAYLHNIHSPRAQML